MQRSLLLSVRFHHGRYHGAGDWPPAPARLFQALIAGVARGSHISEKDEQALQWLEKLPAPIIAAPRYQKGQNYTNYVPNNDLDKHGGDPRRVEKIRTAMEVRSYLFCKESPLLFLWSWEDTSSSEDYAQSICHVAEEMYQLGRGWDMAWAQGEILDSKDANKRLASYPGITYHPTANRSTLSLPHPQPGSLASLKQRFQLTKKRFTYSGKKQLFSQAPKPYFAKTSYNAPSYYGVFELKTTDNQGDFVPLATTKSVALTTWIRNQASTRLGEALPQKTQEIHNVLMGKREATESDKSMRVRITPLPSIGHKHADGALRRVLVDIPPNGTLPTQDILWAFSGLEKTLSSGEVHWSLQKSTNMSMLYHYGISNKEPQKSYRTWYSVTPVALTRPPRTKGEVSGSKRSDMNAKTQTAVKQALRHIGHHKAVESIEVQREPFHLHGQPAGEFAHSSRFTKAHLYHVKITFQEPLTGPLIIGNGRYLGLGLMAPEKKDPDKKRKTSSDVLTFSINSEAPVPTSKRTPLLHAVRRALMACSKQGDHNLPRLFSGHEPDGAPARSGHHDHVFLAVEDTQGDGYLNRLIIAAPWRCDLTSQDLRTDHNQACFQKVCKKLRSIKAGKLGILKLSAPKELALDDAITGPARIWESYTPYKPTRHPKRGQDPKEITTKDILGECQRRGLPKPEVEILELEMGPKGGNISSQIKLHFTTPVTGPLLLGRSSHMGGGFFKALR